MSRLGFEPGTLGSIDFKHYTKIGITSGFLLVKYTFTDIYPVKKNPFYFCIFVLMRNEPILKISIKYGDLFYF